MAFDLSKVNLQASSEVGHEFQLKLPDGTPIDGVFIKVRGANSKIALDLQKKKFNEHQVRQSMAKKRGKEPDPLTIDEVDALSVETAVARTISWRGFEQDGKPIPFSKEEAERIYSDPGFAWIREQVLEESNIVSNFLY